MKLEEKVKGITHQSISPNWKTNRGLTITVSEKRNVSNYYCMQLVKIDREKRKLIEEYMKMGLCVGTAFDIAGLHETIRKRYWYFIQEMGMSHLEACTRRY